MATRNQIRYNLTGVTTEQFAKIFSPGSEDGIKLNITVTVNTNYSSRAIAISSTLNFYDQDKTFLILESTCHFKIEPEDWRKLSEDGEKDAVIPKDIICSMVSISIGTARGILHSRTENTEYNKYLLPLINPQDFKGEDVTIEKTE